jgi:hypothetical protein
VLGNNLKTDDSGQLLAEALAAEAPVARNSASGEWGAPARRTSSMAMLGQMAAQMVLPMLAGRGRSSVVATDGGEPGSSGCGSQPGLGRPPAGGAALATAGSTGGAASAAADSALGEALGAGSVGAGPVTQAPAGVGRLSVTRSAAGGVSFIVRTAAAAGTGDGGGGGSGTGSAGSSLGVLAPSVRLRAQSASTMEPADDACKLEPGSLSAPGGSSASAVLAERYTTVVLIGYHPIWCSGCRPGPQQPGDPTLLAPLPPLAISPCRRPSVSRLRRGSERVRRGSTLAVVDNSDTLAGASADAPGWFTDAGNILAKLYWHLGRRMLLPAGRNRATGWDGVG